MTFIRGSLLGRVTALLTLANMLAVAAPVLREHAESWHDVCERTSALHNSANHRIGATEAQPPDGDHCAVCHWLRTLGSSRPAVGQAIPGLVAARVKTPYATAVLPAPERVASPSRAPPRCG